MSATPPDPTGDSAGDWSAYADSADAQGMHRDDVDRFRNAPPPATPTAWWRPWAAIPVERGCIALLIALLILCILGMVLVALISGGDWGTGPNE